MFAGWLKAWPKPLHFEPWWPDTVSCKPPPPYPHPTKGSRRPPGHAIELALQWGRGIGVGGGFWGHACCFLPRTCGVGSLGARLATIQVTGMGGGKTASVKWYLTMERSHSCYLCCFLFCSQFCEVFYFKSQQGWQCEFSEGHLTGFYVRL